jgi:DNA-binding winged helix-turn-helix (wHTH) protein
MNYETCPHCGQVMRAKKIPMHVILSDVGFNHVSPTGLRLDFKKQVATRNGHPIHVTKTAWYLLALLVAAQGEVVPRDTLLKIAFDTNSDNCRSLDTFVATSRKLLGPVIKTHHGIGYSWCPDGCVVRPKKSPRNRPVKHKRHA